MGAWRVTPGVAELVQKQQPDVGPWEGENEKGGSDSTRPILYEARLRVYYGVGLPAMAAPSGQRLYQLIM